MKSKYQELMNFFPKKSDTIPKLEKMKLTKSVPGTSHPQLGLDNALMKSNSQELKNFSPNKRYTKPNLGKMKLRKSIPDRSDPH